MTLKKAALTSLLAVSTMSSAFAVTRVTFQNNITDTDTVTFLSVWSNKLSAWDTTQEDIGLFNDSSTLYVQTGGDLSGIIRVQDPHKPCAYGDDTDLSTLDSVMYSNANSSWWIDLYNNGSYAGEVCAPIGNDLLAHVSLSVSKVVGSDNTFEATLSVTGFSSESVTTKF